MQSDEKLSRACQRLRHDSLFDLIDRQTDIVHFRNLDQFHGDDGRDLKAGTSEEVWKYFGARELYDTRRLVLEEFHLFDWFPLAPGKFHTQEAKNNRYNARQFLQRSDDGEAYYDPYGKQLMIDGGIGTVRLLPRTIRGEEHYFMTASSTGVCHEGFPVLVPRNFYRSIKPRIVADGFAAATISGEMRYLPEDVRTLFDSDREVPLLYLHVDEPPRFTRPRGEVTDFEISVAVSFAGEFQGKAGTYVTYATFDPATNGDRERACKWIERVYVSKRYRGTVLTDFDEAHPVFPAKQFSLNFKRPLLRGRTPKAVLSLEDLMSGQLNLRALPQEAIEAIGERGIVFIQNYQRQINTGGGAYVGGSVNTGGGKFVGRDSE